MQALSDVAQEVCRMWRKRLVWLLCRLNFLWILKLTAAAYRGQHSASSDDLDLDLDLQHKPDGSKPDDELDLRHAMQLDA